jgi:hypothetical protein
MPGSRSNAPSRTLIAVGSCGLWLYSAAPQLVQKTLSKPPPGLHRPRCSAPESSANEPGTTRAFADAAAPVRCWQRVQWQ